VKLSHAILCGLLIPASVTGQAKPAPKPGGSTTSPSTAATAANKEFQTAVENLRQGRVEIAEPVLTKLWKSAPENPDLNLAMGTLYSMKGDPERAIGFMEKSVKSKPTGQSYAGLAAAYAEMGRVDEAVAAEGRVAPA